MTRSGNGHRQAASSKLSSHPNGQRLLRRADSTETKRLQLLTEILEESSSPKLNDTSRQLMGPRQVAEDHSRLLDLINQLRRLEQDSNPDLPDRTEESWLNFFDWVDKNAASKISDQVGVAKQKLFRDDSCLEQQSNNDDNDADNDEYSLVAKVPIKKGDKVFSIDRKLLLTTETASKDPDLNEFVKKDSIASGMQNVVLVLHLLNEYSKREQSYWWPYLSILPKKILPVLQLTNQTLVLYLLASSHIYEALKLFRSIARHYSYFYQRLYATRLPLRKNLTFDYYAWGVSCVCSRQNEIPWGPTSREPKLPKPFHNSHALIPVLDMCNHCPTSNSAIFADNSSCLFANKDLQPGDEITINYGCQSRSSGEFFIHNGFVPDPPKPVDGKAANYYDVVPVTIGLSKSSKLYEAKSKLMKILNMPTFGCFKMIMNSHANRHKRDPHLSMFLIVFALIEPELKFILDNPNPVGVADEIYEYVHYLSREPNDAREHHEQQQQQQQAEETQLDQIKKRLANKVPEYLKLRANVSMALIDRTLEEFEKQGLAIDRNATRLLLSERRIFETYAIN